MHVNFATNSKLYPYDTQLPSIKLQSLDYGGDLISLTVKKSFFHGSQQIRNYNEKFQVVNWVFLNLWVPIWEMAS